MSQRLRLPHGDDRALKRLELRIPEDIAISLKVIARRRRVTVSRMLAEEMSDWVVKLLEEDEMLALAVRAERISRAGTK